MRKIILSAITFLLLFSSISNAQSFKFGTIAADAGVGFGIYGIRAYSPVNKEEHSGIGAVGTLPSINAEFGLLRILGVGVHYRRGTYGKTSAGKIRGNDFCIMGNIHLANKKDKFDLPIGFGYGLSSFKADLSSNEHIYAKGGIMRIHVSPHIYFSKYIGMYFSLAYNKHFLNKNIEAQDGNGKIYTEADGATWNMGGIEFNFGIAGKF